MKTTTAYRILSTDVLDNAIVSKSFSTRGAAKNSKEAMSGGVVMTEKQLEKFKAQNPQYKF